MTTICRLKFEKANLKKSDSSTIVKEPKNGKKKGNTARGKEHHFITDWSHACKFLGGHCKNQCGNGEFRIAHCISPTILCCMRECDPRDPNSWVPK
uniref:Beta-defensin n=1 Tax=Otolemur garnettii TaxID=30611 RepID=H0XFT7_OTOGA